MSGEFFGTEVATSPALGAGVFQVVLHQHAGYHRSAFVATGNRIVFAGVQVRLTTDSENSISVQIRNHARSRDIIFYRKA